MSPFTFFRVRERNYIGKGLIAGNCPSYEVLQVPLSIFRIETVWVKIESWSSTATVFPPTKYYFYIVI